MLLRSILSSCAVIAIFVTAGACANGGGNNPTGSGGTGGSGGSGVCGSAACEGIGTVCGYFGDACGDLIACNWCQYAADPIPTSSAQLLALSAAPNLQVVHVDGTNVFLSTKGASWTTETVNSAPPTFVDIAQASDGSPWIVFGSGGVQVAHQANGSWTFDKLGTQASAAQIALDTDGVPHVVWRGQDAMGYALYHSKWVGGAWTSELVTERPAVGISFVLAGKDAHIAYFATDTKELLWSKPGANGFDTEIVRSGQGGDNFTTAIAVDKDGEPHIAYIVQQAGPDPFEYVTRKNGQWVTSVVASDVPSGGDFVRLLINAQGIPVVSFIGEDAMLVAEKHDIGWVRQPVIPKCDGNTPFDMALDATGTLTIAHHCGNEPAILKRIDPWYPATYLQACKDTANAICETADQCGGALPCVYTENGSSDCLASRLDCTFSFMDRICGDATQDPKVIDACKTDAPLAKCSASDPGIALPTSCAAFF